MNQEHIVVNNKDAEASSVFNKDPFTANKSCFLFSKN